MGKDSKKHMTEEERIAALVDEEHSEEEEETKDDEEQEEDESQNHSTKESEEEEEDDEDASKKTSNIDDDTEIEVDGEKVTLAELRKGYLRQSDYTRKMQSLSAKEKEEVIDKSKEVIENKTDYPEEDVKAAEYFLKIGKEKFGLLTREEVDAEKEAEKQRTEVESEFQNAEKTVSTEFKGLPAFNRQEIAEYMKDTGIYNPLVAYKDKYESEIRDYIIKQSKGTKSYKTDKGGKKIEPVEKKVDLRTSKGHRDFIESEIDKLIS
jgi:hypothetical protein